MLRLVAQRVLALVPLLLIVSVLTFSFTSLLPSDPVDLILGESGTQEQHDMLRKRMGLDQPVQVRYAAWLGKAVRGDLGTSFFSSVSVTDAVLQRLPVTLSLTAFSALIAIVVGVAAGVAAALKPQSLADRLATLGATFGQAVPNFWFGLILVAIFAVGLRWFPATGFVRFSESPSDWLRSVTLPSIALGLSASAAIARQVRSAMVGVLQQDYIRAARAQGLSRSRVILRHALTNAMVPVVAVLSFQITVLLGGALVVEQVFSINGLGTLAIGAVRQQDIPMLQGLVLVMVALVVAVQLITDIIYGLLNPKARPS
ncbi:MAG: hypothetical protein BGP06_19125 [Rhizobiales bacterium 65-9]|nr:MAG: hypothetical protein BGP06_19125 [Rhizobiales bacterium 65-9]